MHYALIAPSFKGKTHLCKELMKKIQNECPRQMLIYVLCSFPDEWKPSQQNTDQTFYLKRGNIINVLDKSNHDFDQQFDKLLKMVFNEDDKKKPKLVFLDDFSTNIRNNDKRLCKLLTEGRHNYADILMNCHQLNSIYVNLKPFIFDYFLGGPQIYKKTKEFYETMMSQFFDKRKKEKEIDNDGNSQNGDSPNEEYNFDIFWDQLDKFMNPEDKKGHFFRFVQIHLPTNIDPQQQIKFIEPNEQDQVITTNAVYNLIK